MIGAFIQFRPGDRYIGWVIQENGCWQWTGCENGTGYGLTSHWSGERVAHRAVYIDQVGPIPEGMTLDHLCRNRGCVNPAHLEPVSMQVNILRGIGPTAQNAKKTHCLEGHALVAGNIYTLPGTTYRACRQCRHLEASQRAAAKTKHPLSPARQKERSELMLKARWGKHKRPTRADQCKRGHSLQDAFGHTDLSGYEHLTCRICHRAAGLRYLRSKGVPPRARPS